MLFLRGFTETTGDWGVADGVKCTARCYGGTQRNLFTRMLPAIRHAFTMETTYTTKQA